MFDNRQLARAHRWSTLTLTVFLTAALCFTSSSPCMAASPSQELRPITIAQYGHVFLYLPLYTAIERGFFREQGLDVTLVSTGGDEKTFTAVSSGNAQFGVADPVFVAIAQERGQSGKVVAGIVGGAPLWVVATDKTISKFTNPYGFNGKRVATFPAPSTCYAVMKRVLQNNGHPVDGTIVQGSFGSLLAILQAGHADMALEIEPQVSIAVSKGAHVVYSPKTLIGEFAFTGLTVTDDYCSKHADVVLAVVKGLTKAMQYLHSDFNGGLAVAKKQFPDVAEPIVREALKRSLEDAVIPKNPEITQLAWKNAVALRREIGDLKGEGAYTRNVDMRFVYQAAHQR